MRDEKGIALVEVLVSLALLGITAAALLGGLGTASKALFGIASRETAKNLAETQMEYVKGLAYAVSYAPAAISADYAGFSAAIDAVYLHDSTIQKITVTIRRNGKTVTNLEDFKIK